MYRTVEWMKHTEGTGEDPRECRNEKRSSNSESCVGVCLFGPDAQTPLNALLSANTAQRRLSVPNSSQTRCQLLILQSRY